VKLPKKISPCPIIEATVEIRFKSTVPTSAVFGILYDKLKDSYKNYEELPILELPRSVLETDIKLKFLPHYHFLKDNFILQLGPQMVSLSIRNNYSGWTLFMKEIDHLIDILRDVKIIDKVSRIGMRYIDFFESMDVFKNINLQLSLNDKPLDSISRYIRTEFQKEDFRILLQITDTAEVTGKELTKMKGSLIDYDLSINKTFEDFYNEYKELLNKAHEFLKEHFFTILIKKEFLKTLNPEY